MGMRESIAQLVLGRAIYMIHRQRVKVLLTSRYRRYEILSALARGGVKRCMSALLQILT
jgi:hypothetical protein